jgi:hypothetical protein
MFAETGSTALGNPPSISDLIEDVEACLVTGATTPWDATVLLSGGVGARLIPLLRDPRDGGVFGELLSCRSVIARGGDLDFPLESDDPVAPMTPEAARLDVRDFITASTMITDGEKSPDISTASPSVMATRSPLSAIMIEGIATAPHSSGESELSRVIVRPLESDKLND